jgi:hypothetical protein
VEGCVVSDNDPRHGTTAGYIAGCRSVCCWRAKQRYDKRRRWEALQGKPRKVSSVGAVRRVRALQALGWSVPRIAAETGLNHRQIYSLHRYPTVYLRTHKVIADVYERLAMRFPPERTTSERHSATKTRRHAQRNGWPPPLAWDDIDTDPAPNLGAREPRDLLAEWEHLRRCGESIEQAARQLGVTVDAIQKAAERRRVA